VKDGDARYVEKEKQEEDSEEGLVSKQVNNDSGYRGGGADSIGSNVVYDRSD
jgi:hypothetical protein